MKWPIKQINDTLVEFLENDLAARKSHKNYFLDNGRGSPWYTDRSGQDRSLGKETAKLGLPPVKPFHWRIRPSFITWLLNEGLPLQTVQQLADHSDMKTTMGYFNTRIASQKTAVDLLG